MAPHSTVTVTVHPKRRALLQPEQCPALVLALLGPLDDGGSEGCDVTATVGKRVGAIDDGGSEGCDVAATVGKRVGAIDDGGSEGCDVVATVGKTVRKAGVGTAVGIRVGKRVDVIGAAAGWAGVRVDAVAFRMGDGAKEGHTMEFPAASDGTRVGSPDTANSAGAMVPHSGP